MNLFAKLTSKFFSKFLPFIDRMAYFRYYNQPFTRLPKLTKLTYDDLAHEAEANTFSIEDIDLLEKTNGYKVDSEWLKLLAYNTQIVIKKSKLNYAHGRVLYSVLSDYLSSIDHKIKKINILETGTARGFSALCMAKALADSRFEGSICTIDVLPHFQKMYWNCGPDHINGEQSRQNLLSEWSELVERYVIFFQGYTRHVLPKIALQRIHFAFLDGAHTYEDVLFEFNIISKLQNKGDIIVFDDYNEIKFPGVVEAVNYIQNEKNYDISFIHNKNSLRDYVIAKKISK